MDWLWVCVGQFVHGYGDCERAQEMSRRLPEQVNDRRSQECDDVGIRVVEDAVDVRVLKETDCVCGEDWATSLAK